MLLMGVMESEVKKVLLHQTEEYTLSDELAAEMRRVAAKLVGRKVTGELIVNLNDGGVSSVKVREVVKPIE
jgi:hypothetical protein